MRFKDMSMGQTSLGYYWLKCIDPKIDLTYILQRTPDLFDNSYWVIPHPSSDLTSQLQVKDWVYQGNFQYSYLVSSKIYSLKMKHEFYFKELKGYDIYLYYTPPVFDFVFLDTFGAWNTLPFSQFEPQSFEDSYFLRNLEVNQPDVFLTSNDNEFLILCKDQQFINELFMHYELTNTQISF